MKKYTFELLSSALSNHIFISHIYIAVWWQEKRKVYKGQKSGLVGVNG